MSAFIVRYTDKLNGYSNEIIEEVVRCIANPHNKVGSEFHGTAEEQEDINYILSYLPSLWDLMTENHDILLRGGMAPVWVNLQYNNHGGTEDAILCWLHLRDGLVSLIANQVIFTTAYKFVQM